MFEEQFKTGHNARASALECAGDQSDNVPINTNGLSNGNHDGSSTSPTKAKFKRVEKVSLLEANRLRNLGKLIN